MDNSEKNSSSTPLLLKAVAKQMQGIEEDKRGNPFNLGNHERHDPLLNPIPHINQNPYLNKDSKNNGNNPKPKNYFANIANNDLFGRKI